MQEQRIYGSIFSPDEQDDKIEGVWLNITRSSIYLEVPQMSIYGRDNWEVLLGVFNGLDKVTLVNSSPGAGSSGAGGSYRKINVHYLLKDCHLKSYDDLIFNKIHLTSPTICDWITEKEIIKRIDKRTYEIPERKNIFSVQFEGLTISLLTWYPKTSNLRSLWVEKKSVFIIESSQKQHISHLLKLGARIKKWILFVTNKNSEFSNYLLKNCKSERFEMINTLPDLNERKFAQNISINYQDIKDSIQTVFKNWMKSEELETISELLLEKQYNPDLTFQSYFLNMCVAMESFHSIFKKQIQNEHIKQKLEDKENILQLIEDEKLKKRFSNYTKRWNEQTFRQRIKSFKSTFENIMGDTFDFKFKSIVDKIVNTRNSLAHDGTYSQNLEHFELLLIGKAMEFTMKYEVLLLLDYEKGKSERILDSARSNLSTLARINHYE